MAWQLVLEHGWEGLVTKDPRSRSVGGRTIKQPKYREPERGFHERPHHSRVVLSTWQGPVLDVLTRRVVRRICLN
jgi:hypothetical protein